MRRLWHLLAHLTGNFYGSIDSFWEGERLMMCFKCGYCGKLWALSMTVEMLPVEASDIRDWCAPLVSSDCDNPETPEAKS